MADNIPCRHCGYTETLHLRPQDADEPGIPIEGYPVSLEDCNGYEPSDPELARRLAERANKDEHLREMARRGNVLGS